MEVSTPLLLPARRQEGRVLCGPPQRERRQEHPPRERKHWHPLGEKPGDDDGKRRVPGTGASLRMGRPLPFCPGHEPQAMQPLPAGGSPVCGQYLQGLPQHLLQGHCSTYWCDCGGQSASLPRPRRLQGSRVETGSGWVPLHTHSAWCLMRPANLPWMNVTLEAAWLADVKYTPER